MYQGTDRVRQVNELRTLAANIAEGYTVDPEVFGGNAEETATDAVEYYLEEGNHIMPEWFDEHDRGLLVRFTEEAL